MAAGSITIDLLMATGSFETDTQRASRALGRLSKSAKQSADAITREFRDVQNQIAKVGMTANQQKLFDLKEMGASRQQLRAYSRNLEELDAKTKAAATSTTTLKTSFADQARMIGTLVAASAALRTVLQISDDYIKLNGQLKNATQSAAEFGQAYENVERIADTAQIAIGAVATNYARLSNAARELGFNQKEVANITETVALALKVNGASTEEASSAMFQLSQAFGKGKLDGDEFKTAMEAAPPLMRKLAESMGVPFGALKDLAAQGLITGDVMAKAWGDEKTLQDMREQAKEMRTVSGAFTEINNQLTLMVGEGNKATGSMSALADMLGLIADGIKAIRELGGINALVSSIPIIGPLSRVYGAVKPQSAQAAQSESASSGAARAIPEEVKNYQELAKGMNLVSVALGDLKIKEEEAARALRYGKIDPAQYYEITAAINKQREALLKKSTDGSKASIEENKRAAELANTYANLITKATALNAPQETQVDILQRELDAFTSVDAKVKEFIQSQINLARATEEWNHQTELLMDAQQRELELLEQTTSAQYEFEKSIADYVTSVQQSIDPTLELSDNIAKLQSALSLGLIDVDQYEEFKAHLEKMDAETRKATDNMSQYSKQAARNMQDAFADFLFDPFEDGLDGLLLNFVKVLQRMAAEAAAARIFEGIGGVLKDQGGVLGTIGDFFNFGGARAAGGPVAPSSTYLVGERGPELFVPNTAGRIIPNGAGGGSMNVSVNVDASGSSAQGDTATAQRLGDAIGIAVRSELLRQKRPGGILA